MKLKYDESFPERAGECAAKGLNNIQIAREMGIAEDTFYVYLKQFPAFAEAVELGRRAVRDKLDGGMMDLAMGNCFVHTVKRSDSGHEIKTVRQLAPDLNAIIRWLERNKHCADDGWEDDAVQNADPVVLNIPANFKYDESFPEEAECRAADGETDLQIAWRLGICQASFYNYKKQFAAFAAALERGRRECHIRLRRQLLALALGNCTVTANAYRDGDFRKSVKRQLPPNLKAIKYWLAEAASREVRMGAGNQEDRNQNNSVQALSIGSECGESEKSGKREKQEKWNAGTNENDAAQMVSIGSECGGLEKNDGNNGGNENNGNKTEKTDNTSAQRLSIGSESDDCPAGNAETASAQMVSIGSECGGCRAGVPLLRDTADWRFAKMSRKERQRLLKNRREI